eukprot:3941107-Pleurochrysis_carterae.AAC.1
MNAVIDLQSKAKLEALSLNAACTLQRNYTLSIAKTVCQHATGLPYYMRCSGALIGIAERARIGR